MRNSSPRLRSANATAGVDRGGRRARLALSRRRPRASWCGWLGRADACLMSRPGATVTANCSRRRPTRQPIFSSRSPPGTGRRAHQREQGSRAQCGGRGNQEGASSKIPIPARAKPSSSARSPIAIGASSVRPASQEPVEIVVNDLGSIIFGRCTCPHFAEHLLSRGPCEHMLALFKSARSGGPIVPWSSPSLRQPLCPTQTAVTLGG